MFCFVFLFICLWSTISTRVEAKEEHFDVRGWEYSDQWSSRSAIVCKKDYKNNKENVYINVYVSKDKDEDWCGLSISLHPNSIGAEIDTMQDGADYQFDPLYELCEIFHNRRW